MLMYWVLTVVAHLLGAHACDRADLSHVAHACTRARYSLHTEFLGSGDFKRGLADYLARTGVQVEGHTDIHSMF